MDIPILGTATDNPDRVISRALELGAKRPDFLKRYITTIYKDAHIVGINPRVMIAQSDEETGHYTSEEYVNNGNVAGFAVFDDGTTWGLQFTPEDAAHTQLAHMGRYLDLKNVPDTWINLDTRWNVPEMIPMIGSVKNVSDLGNGRWATDPDYADKIIDRYLLYFGESIPMIKPYVLVVAGHRSNTDPGNPTEKSLTGFLAEEYVKQLRASGYQADWWQRDLDGDNQPTMSDGGLDGVALGCAAVLAKRPDSMSVMLDLHYNGAHSPVHVIVPDVTGLSTAYAGGAPSDDTAANNVLDVKLATEIGTNIVKATGLSSYNGRLNVPNVMSERDTGVAEQYAARLAMFAASAKSRAKAVRLVVEHGGYEDTPATKDNFTQLCASAVVKAMDTIFAQNPIDDIPVTIPEKPGPINYPAGIDKSVAAMLFGSAQGYKFDEYGPISKAWIERGRTTGRYPRLIDFHSVGTKKYFVFSDGSVVYQPAPNEVARLLEGLNNA